MNDLISKLVDHSSPLDESLWLMLTANDFDPKLPIAATELLLEEWGTTLGAYFGLSPVPGDVARAAEEAAPALIAGTKAIMTVVNKVRQYNRDGTLKHIPEAQA